MSALSFVGEVISAESAAEIRGRSGNRVPKGFYTRQLEAFVKRTVKSVDEKGKEVEIPAPACKFSLSGVLASTKLSAAKQSFRNSVKELKLTDSIDVSATDKDKDGNDLPDGMGFIMLIRIAA